MSTIKVGINGFGRIGRLVLRAAQLNPKIEVVAINGTMPADYMKYMFQYDTVHGRFTGQLSHDKNNLIVNGKAIKISNQLDPAQVNWGESGADYIVEATGKCSVWFIRLV